MRLNFFNWKKTLVSQIDAYADYIHVITSGRKSFGSQSIPLVILTV